MTIPPPYRLFVVEWIPTKAQHKLHVDPLLIFTGVYYVLQSIIVHRGADAGHFVAYTICHDTWWEYDDATMTMARTTNNEQLVSTDDFQFNSYVILYRKVPPSLLWFCQMGED